MGNAAAKQLDETELGVGSLKVGDERSIVKSCQSSETGTTKIKNDKKTWVQYTDGEEEETLLWSYVNVGMFKSHSVVFDSTKKPVAVIITAKKGMASCTNFICRNIPSFADQEPLSEEELKKAGVKETGGESLYKFAKIVCTRTLTTAQCSYGLVKTANDDDDAEPMYVGEKLASLGFRAIFKEAGDDGAVVAKCYMPGMKMSPHVDAASGTDMLAIVSMGYALVGDESSAGALAGAGVI